MHFLNDSLKQQNFVFEVVKQPNRSCRSFSATVKEKLEGMRNYLDTNSDCLFGIFGKTKVY